MTFAQQPEGTSGATRDFRFARGDSPLLELDGLNIPPERLHWHLADLGATPEDMEKRLTRSPQRTDRLSERYIRRVGELTSAVRRPRQLTLTLEEALHRALAGNYAIEVQRYNPAIESARIVEAEAAFDAVFFTNITKNNIDKPSGSQLAATDLDFFSMTTGVRKLLPTGTQVSGSWEMKRTKIDLAFQRINPEYTSDFILELRQPILRGFGLDYNRSLIMIRHNDRRISQMTFRRQIRDTLRQTEEAYWRLVQARRDVVITARLLADFEQIMEFLDARRDFDVIPVQLNATQASLEASRAEFVFRVATVFNAEDRLVALMNSPDINLADDLEIIPTDFPAIDPLLIDRMGEVQTALEHRQEIEEQKMRVASARLNVGRAKNAELPRFDFSVRTTTSGLERNADRAWDQSMTDKFISYYFGVEVEVPIGNRGARAARRQADLLLNQQMAALKQAFEEVILDVNLAVRAVGTSYDQIRPGFESAEARDREVESIVARAERRDFVILNSELGARQSLAASRRNLLSAMIDFNIALIDLERAKGTLLQYNNVIVPDDGMN